MSNQKKSQESAFSAHFASFLIPIALVIGTLIYMYVFGSQSNFEGAEGMTSSGFFSRLAGQDWGDKHPSNYPGTIYRGGFVVPILLTLFIIVIAVSIERMITISMAKGKGSLDGLVKNVQKHLQNNNIDAAMSECDKNRGSVGNVIRAGLEKYKRMEADTTLEKDEKVQAIKNEIEEATALELPMLERNLVILATITSVGTLLALFGTVLGMIRSFKALANAGAPDASALSTGISEALINTALGIITSALAIIAYNIFTSQIDSMTYRIDEAGFSIAQTYSEKH